MNVVIETLGNEIISDWSFKGYIGASNGGHDVSKMSLSSASMMQSKLKDQRPMPIGSHGYMEWFFNLYGIEKPDPLNIPDFLDVGRKCWAVENRSELTYPVFVKPLRDAKKFTGFVAKSEKDFDLYPELEDWDGPYFCSELIEGEILSEWRWFICEGQVLNVSNYSGDPTLFPNLHTAITVNTVANGEYGSKLPKAYTIDFGCTINRRTGMTWHIIELNRAYSTGPYGINEDDYFKFLKTDWVEMLNQDKH